MVFPMLSSCVTWAYVRYYKSNDGEARPRKYLIPLCEKIGKSSMTLGSTKIFEKIFNIDESQNKYARIIIIFYDSGHFRKLHLRSISKPFPPLKNSDVENSKGQIGCYQIIQNVAHIDRLWSHDFNNYLGLSGSTFVWSKEKFEFSKNKYSLYNEVKFDHLDIGVLTLPTPEW